MDVCDAYEVRAACVTPPHHPFGVLPGGPIIATTTTTTTDAMMIGVIVSCVL